MTKIYALLLWLWFSTPSLAQPFYLASPPHGFGNVDSIETTTSRRYDTETESDYLAYRQIPCHFDYAIKRSPNFFCSSLGSIGSKRFLTDIDFIFHHAFSDNITFRFHGVQKQDFSIDTVAQVAELLYRVDDNQSLGIHGQFDTLKSKDDFGFSYNLHFEELWARFEFNAFDYSRNNRNEGEDRFKQDPQSFTVTFLKSHGSSAYFLNIHLEPQFIWVQPALNTEVRGIRHWVEGFYGTSTSFYSLESRQNLTHIDSSYEDEKVLRLHGQKRFDLVQAGIRGVRKSWATEQGRLVHYDVLPFFWLSPWDRFSNFDLGYEFTWHRSYGHEALRSDSDSSSAIEHRLNLRWHIVENSSGYFRLLFSFDLDRFGSGETWEGGNGQLVFTF